MRGVSFLLALMGWIIMIWTLTYVAARKLAKYRREPE